MPSPPPDSIPSSILILGAGVFGLSTAHALALSPAHRQTTLTVLANVFPTPLPSSSASTILAAGLPTPATARLASLDNTRIIRPDYANADYAALAGRAQECWRSGDVGRDGRYSEAGLVLRDGGGEGGYARASLENVRGQGMRARVLEDDGELREALGSGEGVGLEGGFAYVNETSGWGDAGEGMRWLQRQVVQTGRVDFVGGEVQRLLVEGQKVVGARVASDDGQPRDLRADLTILATGAWTPSLLDMRGIAEAHVQCSMYMSITPDEAARLKGSRVLLDLESGCFYFPPCSTLLEDGTRDWSVKFARHAHGYTNPVGIRRPPSGVGDMNGEETVTVSLPPEVLTIPQRDVDIMLDFAAKYLPSLTHDVGSRMIRTRHCTYLDTASGDFLVTYHPHLQGLFIASGGSGHGFKFLPVIGEAILGVLMGGVDEESNKWKGKWAWPERQESDGVWCEDGSRAGVRGEALDAFR